MTKRILSGVQPSGKLHLGNYFGAIRQHIALQNEGECFYFIADYHALTTIRETAERLAVESAAGAAGPPTCCASTPTTWPWITWPWASIPTKAVFFRQSDVPEVTELAWILSTVTNMGLLERAVLVQGQGRQGHRGQRRPVHLSGADGRRHPHLSLARRAGRQGPGAAPRDDRRTWPASSTALTARSSRSRTTG